jgi:hypothetical protein
MLLLTQYIHMMLQLIAQGEIADVSSSPLTLRENRDNKDIEYIKGSF